ncbi:hypothetical protein CHS0354_031372 [Potamilus streckersoni]|nr:hypothetical protein CHS0354_031372 [Potamilus streckersoni]
MKKWILQYAEQSDSDSAGEDEDSDQFDPNERYIELTALILDLKQEAAETKQMGNKAKQKELSKQIREIIVEMDSLENHPDFNPSVKIKNIESEKASGDPSITAVAKEDPSVNPDSVKVDDVDDIGSGLDLIEQAAARTPLQEARQATKVKEDVRQFEYTRQQWTGKSPKQFLIDWCRKQKCESPKFEKINPRGNKFKCRTTIYRKKDGMLDVCPEILCENVRDAEHLASTLALYHLCKGQSVHQLLPPPYRAVWLEWLEKEKAAQTEEIIKENKPRDQFISKLMKKLEIDDSKEKTQEFKKAEGESWEDLEFDEEESNDVSKKRNSDTDLIKTHCLKGMNNLGLLKFYEKHTQTAQCKKLYQSRQALPVFQNQDFIIEAIRRDNIVLIAGETGSGKSTQIPHFILQDCLQSGEGQNCNIICTQPRRISAISLATRVSQEMGETTLGSQDSLCGYQIRLETRRGPNTKLLYCTTGVILRQLQLDPLLKDVTHILVDEVHERSVQSDFLLIVLKRLLAQRLDLRVILMSATLDAEKFSKFFNNCPIISIPGRTYPVEVFHIEDAVEMTGYVLNEDSSYALRQDQLLEEDDASLLVTEKAGEQSKLDVFWTKEDLSTIDRTSLPPDRYSLRTRNIVTRLNHKRINIDLILEILVYIQESERFSNMPGAVLVFLPGLSDIQELYEVLQSDHRFSEKNGCIILALHSVLSSADQNSAFNIPPAGIRKIVLATNIAETGITIPDVVFVIDSGKVKENRYMESSQMSALEEVFISKASAKQRQGRAGRVQNGFCFRLYTKEMYDDMRPYTIPELLRVPLEELCLTIMKCNFGKPEDFLSQALDPPQEQVVARAMTLLHEVGACRDGYSLTALGHHLAALPVHVRIGKMLLYSAIIGCLEPVAVIAAAMTDRSPFLVPIGKQDLANTAKQSLAVAASDHLTVFKAYVGWKEAQSKGRQAEMTYCQKHFLRRNTLLEIENVKTDLIRLVISIGFQEKTSSLQSAGLTDSDKGVLQISKAISSKGSDLDIHTIAKVKAVLTAGLYPNVATVTYLAPVDAVANPEKKVCAGETPQGPAYVHPSSVNRYLQATGCLVYHEKVRSSKVYLRDCTLVGPYPILLFGGEIHVQHISQSISVDDRIQYKAYAKTGVIFTELRKLLDGLLSAKLDDPSVDISGSRLVSLIQELLVAEKTR